MILYVFLVFVVRFNWCEPAGSCDSDCITCNANYCELCNPGFSSMYGKCLKCPDNCVNCLRNELCLTCATGFYHYNGICTKCTPFCKICSDDTTCDRCVETYFINDNNTCEACEAGCKNCSANDVCFECMSGHYLVNDRCKPCSSNCKACFTPTECIACVDGFQLETGKCEHCLPGRYIRYPYGRFKSACIECPESCYECFSKSNCSHCNEGFYGIACQYNCSSCEDNACAKIKCKDGCKTGYFLNTNGGCSLCNGCVGDLCYNGTGKCILGCHAGFYLDDTRCYMCPHQCETCSSIGKCDSCLVGNWGNNCEFECIPECVDSLCNIATGSCETQSECETGRYLGSDNDCLVCPRYCSTCVSNETCTTCIDGHIGKVCEDVCSSNCKTCWSNNKSKCRTCVSGMYLDIDNHTCNTCYNSCSSCDGSEKHECFSCITNNFIENKTCTNCPIGCASCVSMYNCTSCISGYRHSNGTCNKCPVNCANCSPSNVCFQCDDGYFGATCSERCLEQCQTCHNNFSCATCSPGRFCIANDMATLTCECSATECSTIDSRNGNQCSACFKTDWFPLESGCCPGAPINLSVNKTEQCLQGCDSRNVSDIDGLVFGIIIGGVGICIAFITIGVVVYYTKRKSIQMKERNIGNNEEMVGIRYENLILNDIRRNTSSDVQRSTYESLQDATNEPNHYSVLQPRVAGENHYSEPNVVERQERHKQF